MEPVYGILLAFFLFGDAEKMSLPFYAGTVLVISSLFLESWIKRRNKLKVKEPSETNL